MTNSFYTFSYSEGTLTQRLSLAQTWPTILISQTIWSFMDNTYKSFNTNTNIIEKYAIEDNGHKQQDKFSL